MNILIYGSGAVGIGIAAALYDSGCQVDMHASGQTKAAIEKNGIKRFGLFKEINVAAGQINIFERLSDIVNKKYDFIAVCTKTNANKSNAIDLNNNRNLLNANGKIVIFQNGWGNDEPYLEYFDKSIVYNARVITGFARPQRHISEITVHAAPFLIGSLHGQDLNIISPLAKAINDGGIPCEITTDVASALWAKVLYNCTLNPLGAVLNVNYGKLTECPNSIAIMDSIIDEIFNVLNASGYKTYWATSEEYKKEFYSELVPSTYGHRSSTLQDIEKKILTEIDSLSGSIMRLGVRYNIPTPNNTMMYNMIKTMESYY